MMPFQRDISRFFDEIKQLNTYRHFESLRKNFLTAFLVQCNFCRVAAVLVPVSPAAYPAENCYMRYMGYTLLNNEVVQGETKKDKNARNVEDCLSSNKQILRCTKFESRHLEREFLRPTRTNFMSVIHRFVPSKEFYSRVDMVALFVDAFYQVNSMW